MLKQPYRHKNKSYSFMTLIYCAVITHMYTKKRMMSVSEYSFLTAHQHIKGHFVPLVNKIN